MTESTKEKKFVSAVVYLRNDSLYVNGFLEMITKVLSESFTEYELIFVNDASTDDSVAKIHKYCEENDRHARMISIVQLSHYQGQETAVNAGRDLAIGDFVFEFDDMLIDYDPSMIMDVYKKALSGFDIVSSGADNASGITSRAFYGIYNKLAESGEDIDSETFRILSRRAINQIKSIDRYIPYRKAIYMNCGLASSRIGYDSPDPGARKKALRSRHERGSLAIDSLIYFTNAMGKLAWAMCIVFAIIAVGVGADIIYETVALTHPVEGWRSTMGFISVGFFGIFLILSIIVRYLSVLLNVSFKRSRYLIAEIDKVTTK